MKTYFCLMICKWAGKKRGPLGEQTATCWLVQLDSAEKLHLQATNIRRTVGCHIHLSLNPNPREDFSWALRKCLGGFPIIQRWCWVFRLGVLYGTWQLSLAEEMSTEALSGSLHVHFSDFGLKPHISKFYVYSFIFWITIGHPCLYFTNKKLLKRACQFEYVV